VKVAGGLKVGHFIGSSVKVGLLMNRLKSSAHKPARWTGGPRRSSGDDALIEIES